MGMEGWRDGGMEGWRDGGMGLSAASPNTHLFDVSMVLNFEPLPSMFSQPYRGWSYLAGKFFANSIFL
jgi:hypothetical protein